MNVSVEIEMIVLFLLLVSGFDLSPGLDKLHPNPKVCKTKACYQTADRVRSYMDCNIDPCEDFYRFACGNFLKTGIIPPSEVELNIYKETEQKVESQLKKMMEEETNNQEAGHELYVKQIYYLCMEEKKINERGETLVLNMIKKLGGWPVMNGSWTAVNWNPMDLEARIERILFGVGSLLSLGVDVSQRGNDTVKPKLLYIGKPMLGQFGNLDICDILSYGLNKAHMNQYFHYMVDIAVIIGANRATAELKLKDVLDFMVELCKISKEENLMNPDEMYPEFSIQDLINHPKLGWLDWNKYFKELHLPIIGGIPKKVMIDYTYIANLGPLLLKTPSEGLKNFMIWCAIQRVFPFAHFKITKRINEFESVVSGTKQMPLRWEKCVRDVSAIMSVATASMYVKRFVNPELKHQADKMVSRITQEMLSMMQRKPWILFWTKQLSKRKLLSMKRWIGYPSQILDIYEMDKYHLNLTIDIDDYHKAASDVLRFLFNMKVSAVDNMPSDTREDWLPHSTAFATTASYSHIENSIGISAPLLHAPFFRLDVPDYVNFAALGNIIGHEITHGFDNWGRDFNYLGLMTDWWDESSKENFDNRTQCFVEQYGNFTESTTKLKLNGTLTLGENIADQGGVRVAFNTYSNEHQEEPALPGLEHMNNKQLFMLILANNWCSKMRPENLENSIKTSKHSPEEFRVIGMMMNLREFGELFNCPVGSPMNPKKKCQLW